MAIRAAIFDLGGVLLVGGRPLARRAWEERLGLQPGGLDRALGDAIGPGWAGGRTEEEIHQRLGDVLGLPVPDVVRLLSDLEGDSYIEPELAELIRKIRSTHRVAILANNGPDVRSHLNARFGLEELVDLVVISGEEGMAKPDPTIYRLTADRLGVDPVECVFVDDRPENVEGARVVGMEAVLHRDVGNTVKCLRSILGLPE
ncbi:MAG TPA: HAD family phosphatase [Acidimicrobiales bacterium]|nr:HAD family phosphatase [Acidimicrobiales bacterium]